MNKTKKFRLFTFTKDEYTLHINTTLKDDGTFRSRSDISFYNKKEIKEYKLKNKERIKENRRQYYQNNKEIQDIQAKEYKRNHPKRVKVWSARRSALRKGWGYDPINNWFEGCNFHHTHINNNHDKGIHIPGELHNSVRHSYKDKESMNKINKLAYEWLKNNEGY